MGDSSALGRTQQGASHGARVAPLDGLRGLAAVGVALLHVELYHRGDAHQPPPVFADRVLLELRVGVVMFFVLSGYLIYRPWVAAALDGTRGPALRTYALRRVARIVPAYWLAVVGAFVLVVAIGHPLAPSARQLPAFLLLMQNYFPGTRGQLDPPMWSVVVEASFYLAVPPIGWLALRIGARRGAQLALCFCLMALGTASLALARIEMWPQSARATLPLLLGYFGAGMLVAVVAHRRRWPRTAGAALIAAGCAVVVGNSVWHVHHELPLRYHLHDTPAAIGFALVIAGLVATPLRPRVLMWAPVQALGTISFGIYLWHFPAIVLLRNRGWWPHGFLAEAAATLSAAVIAATISWFAVERPALSWAHRRRTGAARSSRRAAPARLHGAAVSCQRQDYALSQTAGSCD